MTKLKDITSNGSLNRQLAQLLVAERKARHLRQQDIARRLQQYQSFVARTESGQRRIDVGDFFAFAAAIGFNASIALKKIQGATGNGGAKPKTRKHKNQVGPTCVAEFADGTRTRMTTCTSLEKLDWDRGVRLSRAAYQSRHPGAPVPPAIISVHFEQDGKVLAQRKGETNVVVRN